MFETTKGNVSAIFPIEVTMDRWTSYIDAAIPSICNIFLCFSLVMVFQRFVCKCFGFKFADNVSYIYKKKNGYSYCNSDIYGNQYLP